MNTTNISRLHLPQELIEEILPKLPVKSLLRFRFVSKSWDSLIRSERFVKAHLDNSIANPAFADHLIFLNYLDKKPGLRFSVSTTEEATAVKHYPMHSLMNELIDELPADRMYDFRFPTTITVLGSCNGLVCFVKRYCFYLCNPSTRTSIQLPRMEPWSGFTKCGFGFDEWSDAYKVFVVWYFNREYSYKVYSSKTNAWRAVEFPKVDWGLSTRAGSARRAEIEGILVSGKLHWPRTMNGENGGGLFVDILTFDLKSEVFGTMDLPFDTGDVGDSWFSFHISLAVLDRCLTVVHSDDKHLDVWVMMEYGVKDSWIKVMNFAFPYGYLSRLKAATLCFGPNGEILMTYGAFFLAYDLRKRRLLQMKKFEALCDGEGAHLFVESLVCPKRVLEQHGL